MNWKIILGVLLVIGGVGEMSNLIDDHRAGITVGFLYPVTLLITAAFIFGGFSLIYFGRKKKKPF
ncbi:MAG TPA: hypothetical protein VK645_01840 [Chitinophagaceae bacterium]|nr:hypothetical protein [Chitinophagaceae bacterium]